MVCSFKNWQRGIPPVILNFLLSWYRMQWMRVQWSPDCIFQTSFAVANGVRQGGVLSPFLYLLYELSLASVGCFWRWMFAGVFCFADDIAPCASALCIMLSICSSYAASHGLIFNSEKTQLVLCFRKYAHEPLRGFLSNILIRCYTSAICCHLI